MLTLNHKYIFILHKIKYSWLFFLIRFSDKEGDEYLQKLLEVVSEYSEFSHSGYDDYVPQNLRKNAYPKEFSDTELSCKLRIHN